MMKQSAILHVLLLAASTALSAGRETPRLGIIAGPSMDTAADLLTVELDKADVEMLERGEIDRVLREQALQVGGMTRGNSMQVGRLLKADGLLFLQQDGAGDAGHTQVRLVAVDPGMIVWMEPYLNGEIREKTTARWVREMAEEVAARRDRLRVSRDHAVPISLVQLRAPLDDAPAVQLDRDINRLVRLRLAREPAIFVLDRDNLMQLEEEKRWSGDASGFWTGSRLLDGDIRPDLITTNKVTVSLTLRTADGKTEAQWAEVGVPGALPSLVDRLIVRLVKELGRSPATEDWSAEREAEEFFKAARRRRFHSRFKAAIESAWVLGRRDEAAARLYMDALTGDAQFAGEAPYSFVAERAVWRGGRADQYKQWVAADASRVLEATTRCQRALDFFLSRREALRTAKRREFEPWCRQGLMQVNNAVWLLQSIKNSKQVAAHREAACDLQQAARGVLDVIWVTGHGETTYVTEDVAIYRAWLWNTPDELLAVIRKALLAPHGTWAGAVMDHGCHMLMRETLITPDALQPALPELASTQGRSAEECWADLQKDLLTSDVKANRVFVRRRLRDQATTPEAKAACHKELLNALWDARDEVAKGWVTLYRCPLDRNSDDDAEFGVKLFEYVCDNLGTGYWPVIERIESLTLGDYLYRHRFTDEQVRRVLAAAARSKDAVPKSRGMSWVIRKAYARYPELKPPPSVSPLRVDGKLFITSNRTVAEPIGNPPQTDVFHWVDDRVWFFWDDVFCLDIKRGDVDSVPGPRDELAAFRLRLGGERAFVVQHFVVTRDHFVVMLTNRPNNACPTQILIRERKGGGWTSHEIRPTVRPQTVRHRRDGVRFIHDRKLRHGPARHRIARLPRQGTGRLADREQGLRQGRVAGSVDVGRHPDRRPPAADGGVTTLR